MSIKIVEPSEDYWVIDRQYYWRTISKIGKIISVSVPGFNTKNESLNSEVENGMVSK